MVRDFSDVKRDELKKQLEQVQNEDQFWLFDCVGDIVSSCSKWIGALDIQNYLNNVDDYHRKIIDQKDMELAELQKIFDNVDSVDSKYAAELGKITTGVSEYVTNLQRLTSVISMDKKDFTAANVLNAKGVIESSVDTALLGVVTVYDKQRDAILDRKEKEALKETIIDLGKDVFSLTVNIVSLGANLAIGNYVGVAVDAWQLAGQLVDTYQDINSAVLIVSDKNSMSKREEDLEKAIELQEADGIAGQLEMEGKEGAAAAVKAADLAVDVIGIVNSVDALMKNGKKFSKIISDGRTKTTTKIGKMKDMAIDQMGFGLEKASDSVQAKKGITKVMKKYNKETTKKAVELAYEFKKNETTAKFIKNVYTYTTEGLSGDNVLHGLKNIGEEVVKSTDIGGLIDNGTDLVKDGIDWAKDIKNMWQGTRSYQVVLN